MRNGHGKTTLLRMIVGEETPDTGQIVIPRNYRIGYVRQHLDFTEDTVLAEGMKGLPESRKEQHWKVEKVLAGLGFSQEDMQRSPLEFSGDYQVRLNLAWEDEEEAVSAPRKPKAEKDGAEKLDKRDLCKRRAEIITERSRVLGPLEKGIARVEAEIEAREKRLKLLHTAMQEIEDLFVEPLNGIDQLRE